MQISHFRPYLCAHVAQLNWKLTASMAHVLIYAGHEPTFLVKHD